MTRIPPVDAPLWAIVTCAYLRVLKGDAIRLDVLIAVDQSLIKFPEIFPKEYPRSIEE